MNTMTTIATNPKANKTDAGNGSKAIYRVSNVLRSPSPDPSRSPNFESVIPILMQPVIESNAALLRKLHETIHETFRHRSEGPEAHAAWSRACREFHDRWDELAFPGGLRSGLHRIESGDLQAIETAIRYLELRPFYFRAQYTRDVFTRLLKRQALPARLQQRFDATRERLRAWREAKRTRSDRLHALARSRTQEAYRSDTSPA